MPHTHLLLLFPPFPPPPAGTLARAPRSLAMAAPMPRDAPVTTTVVAPSFMVMADRRAVSARRGSARSAPRTRTWGLRSQTLPRPARDRRKQWGGDRILWWDGASFGSQPTRGQPTSPDLRPAGSTVLTCSPCVFKVTWAGTLPMANSSPCYHCFIVSTTHVVHNSPLDAPSLSTVCSGPRVTSTASRLDTAAQ